MTFCIDNVYDINGIDILIYMIILLFFINYVQIYIYLNLQLCKKIYKNCCKKEIETEYLDSITVYLPRY